jgi:exopolysaccharide biosynthesis predicted pyruvyltransferase EpsI
VFQTQYVIKNEMVVYEHKDFPIPADFPKLNNRAELEDVVQLLGGAEYVLTNSYHGLYWSVLLGRKVILYKPFSSRFFNSPWTVPIITDLQELETKERMCSVQGCYRTLLTRTKILQGSVMFIVSRGQKLYW